MSLARDLEPSAVHASRCAVWQSDEPCDCGGWRELARCAQLPAQEADRIFFPDPTRNAPSAVLEAMSVCAQCPVRRDCTEYAERTEVGSAGALVYMSGVWGGESARGRYRRRRGL